MPTGYYDRQICGYSHAQFACYLLAQYPAWYASDLCDRLHHRVPRQEFYDLMRTLHTQGLVSVTTGTHRGGGVLYSLTSAGHSMLLSHSP